MPLELLNHACPLLRALSLPQTSHGSIHDSPFALVNSHLIRWFVASAPPMNRARRRGTSAHRLPHALVNAPVPLFAPCITMAPPCNPLTRSRLQSDASGLKGSLSYKVLQHHPLRRAHKARRSMVAPSTLSTVHTHDKLTYLLIHA